MNRTFFYLYILYILLGLMGCTAAPSLIAEPEPIAPVETGLLSQTLVHDDLERSYLVFVPEAANNGEALPLLLNLHGFTGTAESQLNYADFRLIAEREGIILVYPQGTLLGPDTHWNVGSWTRRSTADDVGFLSELIDTLTDEYKIDADRVYSIGHSNGGYMSFQLACQIGDQITAVASMSGTMTPENFDACNPAHPTPILQIHGTADTVVPYAGASWSKSVDDVLDYWAGVNNISAEPMVSTISSQSDSTASTTIKRFQFGTTKDSIMMEHIMVEDGGHEWLGQPNALGEVNLDLDTNEVIWAFLSQFSLSDLDNS